MTMFKFRALVDMETIAHGGPTADMPGSTARIVVRCHAAGGPGAHFLTALLSTDDGEPLHAGDRYRIVTLTTPDPDALHYLAPATHFDLWQGHDLGHGTITRRLIP